MTDLQKIMPFSFLKKIINENNEIPCFVILQHKYRFRANLNLLANRPSLPAAFIVGPLVLQRERETETETERQRDRETERDRERQTEIPIQYYTSAGK